jgi:hypothetical protein
MLKNESQREEKKLRHKTKELLRTKLKESIF